MRKTRALLTSIKATAQHKSVKSQTAIETRSMPNKAHNLIFPKTGSPPCQQSAVESVQFVLQATCILIDLLQTRIVFLKSQVVFHDAILA